MSGKLIQVRNSTIHGRGVFAAAPIKKGTRLIQYKGKLLTHAEADKMYGSGSETGHTFLFTLNEDYVIDANQGGNAARWINHGCAPNCESTCESAGDDDPSHDRVFIEALRHIKPGEELTYNYLITLETPHTARLKKIWECRCGAKSCSGTMLAKKR
jgi:SET domain-containing protein